MKSKLGLYFVFLLKFGLTIYLIFALNHDVYERYSEFIEQKCYFALTVYLFVWVISLLSILYIGFIHNLIIRVLFSFVISFFMFISELHYVILKIAPRIESFEMIFNELGNFNNAFNTYSQLALIPLVQSSLFFIVLVWPYCTLLRQ